MKPTRQEVEKWLEDTKTELGVEIISIELTPRSKIATYTIHLDGDCVSIFDPWEETLENIAAHKAKGPDKLKADLLYHEEQADMLREKIGND